MTNSVFVNCERETKANFDQINLDFFFGGVHLGTGNA